MEKLNSTNYSTSNKNSSYNITPMNNNNSPQPENNKSIWDNILDFFNFDFANNSITNNPQKINEKRIENIKTYKNYKRCQCPRTHSKHYCDSIYELICMIKNNTKNDIDSENSIKLYQGLLKVCDRELDINGENIKQIKKDLARTYPSSQFFKDEKIRLKLKNVLRAFSNYEPKIKYFQGMNFIVGFFLYHCEEHVAFWLFVSIMEEYNLRDLFMKGFPGLSTHVKKVESILQKQYSNLYEDLNKIGVKYEIFMMEWLYSLFSSLIPLELQIDFYKGFFSQGWKFFYKMCVSVLTNLNGTFNGPEEIYIALKCGTNDDNVTEDYTYKYWAKIINKAYSIEID